MGSTNQKGFTIIETSLFLAISALLFVGLISGVSISIQRQRYTDSIQSTYSFLQKQFNETLNAVNNRPKSEDCVSTDQQIRGASRCVVLGKAIFFDITKDEITVQTIYGEEPASTVINPTLIDYSPTIKEDTNQEKFLIPWSAKIVTSKIKTSTSFNAIDVVALIRSPVDGSTSVFAFKYDEAIDTPAGTLNSAAIDGAVTQDTPAKICIQSQDIVNSFSSLTFDGVGSQDGLVLKADATAEECEQPS